MKRVWVVLILSVLSLSSSSCRLILEPAPPVATITAPQSAVAAGTSTPGAPPVSRPSTATPPATPQLDELALYVVELVNKDRADYGLSPVVPGDNPAAQRHADDMFSGYYLSHWDTDGMKPYVRYSVGGGVNYEGENSAYSGWYDKSENPNHYAPIDARQELKELEYRMMYDDAGSDWGHRDNILNERHKRVNVGIAYDGRRLTLVQQFEGDYVALSSPPQLTGGVLTVSGAVSLGAVDSVAVFYDPLPRPMTQSELLAGPRSYGLGARVVTVLAPPPPGYFYSQLPADAIQASLWEVSPAGGFTVRAELDPFIVQYGPGVYTVVIWSKVAAEYVALTNYSVFVR